MDEQYHKCGDKIWAIIDGKYTEEFSISKKAKRNLMAIGMKEDELNVFENVKKK